MNRRQRRALARKAAKTREGRRVIAEALRVAPEVVKPQEDGTESRFAEDTGFKYSRRQSGIVVARHKPR